MLETIIKGGKIVTGSGVYEGDIGIKDGKIATVADNHNLQGEKIIDATGKIVMPGFIDVHVHHRTQVPGLTTVDTPSEVSQIAAYGGITTFIFYIGARWNSKPSQDAQSIISTPEEFYGRVIEQEQSSLVIDFGIHCMLFPNKDIISQLPAVAKMGIKSFKMVLGYHPSRGWLIDDSLLMFTLDTIASIGGLAMFHCENGYVIGYLEDKYIAQDNYNAETFLSARPNLAEAETVYRTICLGQMTNCPIYIVHLSSKEGLDNIARARGEGKKVIAETCPQYLLLNDKDMRQQGALLKMAPPIRLIADNEALWRGIQAGIIDVMGSDHVSLGKSQKLSTPNFQSVPFGIPGIETIAPLIFSEGVSKGKINLPKMAQILSENAAKTFGLYPRKGTIQQGSDADLVIIDPDYEWEIRAETLHSKVGFSPYQGWKVKGKPVLSLLRGELLLKDGKLHQQPGFGHYLSR
jgi:dihydropyrimidinase